MKQQNLSPQLLNEETGSQLEQTLGKQQYLKKKKGRPFNRAQQKRIVFVVMSICMDPCGPISIGFLLWLFRLIGLVGPKREAAEIGCSAKGLSVHLEQTNTPKKNNNKQSEQNSQENNQKTTIEKNHSTHHALKTRQAVRKPPWRSSGQPGKRADPRWSRAIDS